MDSVKKLIADNVCRVFERVEMAAEKSGRAEAEISVVAVTKYVDVSVTRLLADCLIEFAASRNRLSVARPRLGESRPQLLDTKVKSWGDGPAVDWHFIGPLQSNKIVKVAPVCTLIHSVDRIELLLKLDRYCTEQAIDSSVLLEFNISGEAAKHGFTASDLSALEQAMNSTKSLRFCGLMGMGGLESDSVETRKQFDRLAQLLPQVQQRLPLPKRDECNVLSMGMSGDLEDAIAAGSTMVRVGSSFFEGIR